MTQEDSVYANLSKEDRDFVDTYPTLTEQQKLKLNFVLDENRNKWIVQTTWKDGFMSETSFSDLDFAVRLFCVANNKKAFYVNKQGHRTDVTELFKNY